MIELGHPQIPVKRQCELLGVPRSSAYYAPVGESAANLALMRLIDELYTLHPFYGVRQITRRLRQLGNPVNFKRVRRLMRLMGLVAQVPKPNLSKPAPGHRIYPYLLRNLEVVRANQVWAMDITYIPMARGFIVRLRRGPSDFGYDPMISPTLCLISSTALKSKFSLPPMAFAVGSGRMRTSSGSSRKVLSATGKWQPRRGGMACAGRC